MRWFIIIGLSIGLSPRSEFPGSCPLFTFTNRGFSSFALREWLNPCPTCASAQLLLFYKVEYVLRSMDRQSLRVWRVAHWIILRCGCVSSVVVTRWLSDGREVTNGVPWIMWGWYSFGETNPLGRSESSSRTRCEVLCHSQCMLDGSVAGTNSSTSSAVRDVQVCYLARMRNNYLIFHGNCIWLDLLSVGHLAFLSWTVFWWAHSKPGTYVWTVMF